MCVCCVINLRLMCECFVRCCEIILSLRHHLLQPHEFVLQLRSPLPKPALAFKQLFPVAWREEEDGGGDEGTRGKLVAKHNKCIIEQSTQLSLPVVVPLLLQLLHRCFSLLQAVHTTCVRVSEGVKE